MTLPPMARPAPSTPTRSSPWPGAPFFPQQTSNTIGVFTAAGRLHVVVIAAKSPVCVCVLRVACIYPRKSEQRTMRNTWC